MDGVSIEDLNNSLSLAISEVAEKQESIGSADSSSYLSFDVNNPTSDNIGWETLIPQIFLRLELSFLNNSKVMGSPLTGLDIGEALQQFN